MDSIVKKSQQVRLLYLLLSDGFVDNVLLQFTSLVSSKYVWWSLLPRVGVLGPDSGADRLMSRHVIRLYSVE